MCFYVQAKITGKKPSALEIVRDTHTKKVGSFVNRDVGILYVSKWNVYL
jgi:tetrahydromethanopterin S-methyltransferase subunit G